MAVDIKIQRGYTTVSADEETVSITAVGSLDSAFVVITANRMTTGGTDTGNAYNDDLSVGAYLSAVDEITFARLSPTPGEDAVVAWEVWEYVGSAGGANEFIVRSRDSIDLTNVSSNSATLTDTPDDIDACIPFINGIVTNKTTADANFLTVLAYLSGTGTLNANAVTDSATRSVHVTTVEFTGSNWSVGHGLVSGSTADSGSISLVTGADGASGSTFTVSDWSTAIIAAWGSSGDTSNRAIADNWPCLYPNTSTSVTFAFNSQHDGSADAIMVHVLQHDDLVVTRFTDTSSTAGDTSVDISSASLSDLTASSILGTSTSSGGGTAYARGWRDYRLTALDTAVHHCGRSGNTLEHRLQVIDWTGITSTASDDYSGDPAVSATTGVAVTGTATEGHTDDFMSSSLDSMWTVVDNQSDSTVTVSGGQVHLSIPSGTEHDPWHPTNHATYIRRDQTDGDFEAIAKFDSDPDATSDYYKGHGFLFLTDNGTFVRFDVFQSSVGPFLFASYVTPSSADNKLNVAWPYDSGAYIPSAWFRVTRVGDVWTCYTSQDPDVGWDQQVQFTQAITINYIGLMVDNADGTSPAYTADVDWVDIVTAGDAYSGDPAVSATTGDSVSGAKATSGSVTASAVTGLSVAGAKGQVKDLTVPSLTAGVSEAGFKSVLGAASTSAATGVAVSGSATEAHSGDVAVSAAVVPAADGAKGSRTDLNENLSLAADVAGAKAGAGSVPGLSAATGSSAAGAKAVSGTSAVSATTSLLVTGTPAEAHSGAVNVSAGTGTTADGSKGSIGDASVDSSAQSEAVAGSGRTGAVAPVSVTGLSLAGRKSALSGSLGLTAFLTVLVEGEPTGVAYTGDVAMVATAAFHIIHHSGGRASEITVPAATVVQVGGYKLITGVPEVTVTGDTVVSGVRFEAGSPVVGVAVTGGSARTTNITDALEPAVTVTPSSTRSGSVTLLLHSGAGVHGRNRLHKTTGLFDPLSARTNLGLKRRHPRG